MPEPKKKNAPKAKAKSTTPSKPQSLSKARQLKEVSQSELMLSETRNLLSQVANKDMVLLIKLAQLSSIEGKICKRMEVGLLLGEESLQEKLRQARDAIRALTLVVESLVAKPGSSSWAACVFRAHIADHVQMKEYANLGDFHIDLPCTVYICLGRRPCEELFTKACDTYTKRPDDLPTLLGDFFVMARRVPAQPSLLWLPEVELSFQQNHKELGMLGLANDLGMQVAQSVQGDMIVDMSNKIWALKPAAATEPEDILSTPEAAFAKQFFEVAAQLDCGEVVAKDLQASLHILQPDKCTLMELKGIIDLCSSQPSLVHSLKGALGIMFYPHAWGDYMATKKDTHVLACFAQHREKHQQATPRTDDDFASELAGGRTKRNRILNMMRSTILGVVQTRAKASPQLASREEYAPVRAFFEMLNKQGGIICGHLQTVFAVVFDRTLDAAVDEASRLEVDSTADVEVFNECMAVLDEIDITNLFVEATDQTSLEQLFYTYRATVDTCASALKFACEINRAPSGQLFATLQAHAKALQPMLALLDPAEKDGVRAKFAESSLQRARSFAMKVALLTRQRLNQYGKEVMEEGGAA